MPRDDSNGLSHGAVIAPDPCCPRCGRCEPTPLQKVRTGNALEEHRGGSPPHDHDAERAVLGAILLRGDLPDDVAEAIGAEDIHNHRHRLIWRAICDLAASGTTPDTFTVKAKLGGDLERCGGLDYLLELSREIPSAETVAHHVGIVLDKSHQRQLLKIAGDIPKRLRSGAADFDEVLLQVQGEVASISIAREPAWPDLQPLPSLHPPAPELPPELLPEPLRAWLVREAQGLCTPLAGVAAPALVALSAVVGRGARIHPEPGSPWTVIPNLWGCTVAPPGLLKSAALTSATAPLGPLTQRARAEAEDRDIELRPKRMALEAKLSKTKRKGDCDPNEIRHILEDLDSCRVPVRRHVVMDATLEKLQEIQRDNPRGLLLLRDELAGWLAGLTKAGHETDRGYYLEAWDGDTSSTVDRIGRGTIYVPANCLSLYGTIQPARLTPLVEGVTNGTGDDGLLQRLQVLVFVDTLPPWAAAPATLDTFARDRVTQIFETIDGTLSAERPKIVRFDAEAQAVFHQWREALERRIRQGDLRENPIKCGHLSKYRSLMPSLATIFHLVEEVGALDDRPRPAREDDSIRICADCARLAVEWCSYLEQHVDRLHLAAARPELVGAYALAAKIRNGAVEHGQTVRDIHRRHWKNLDTAKQVESALSELEECGWARRRTIPTRGRSQIVVELHPQIREGELSALSAPLTPFVQERAQGEASMQKPSESKDYNKIDRSLSYSPGARETCNVQTREGVPKVPEAREGGTL